MINLFEKYDERSQNLLRSELMAKIKLPTVIMEDNGFLPATVDSPIRYFCGLEHDNHPALYFDKLPVPAYWRITGTATGGQVLDLDHKRANIIFYSNDNSRLIKEVQWLNTQGQVAWVDCYNQHGRRFAKVVYTNGRPAVKRYYNRKGSPVLTQNLGAGDLFLNYRGVQRHFPNLIALTTYYLHLCHYDLERVFYNTLNLSLNVVLNLPKNGEDTLFWAEPVGDQLPGNMTYLMQHSTRTKHIIFQNYRDWQRIHKQLPTDSQVDFQYLGITYPHPRGNALQPNALILTDSDQLEQFRQLVTLLPQVTFYVVALTNMSDKLMAMHHYANVKLYPRASDHQIRHLLKICDLYLDINHGSEILDAVLGAFEQNMLILGFNNTLHRPQLVLPANVYAPAGVKQMAQKILTSLISPKTMKNLIDSQRKDASEVLPKEYQRVLGAIIDGKA